MSVEAEERWRGGVVPGGGIKGLEVTEDLSR